MAGLLHPNTSTVMITQQAFLDLLLSFSPDTEAWSLLKAIGATFTDKPMRQFCRQQVIGYASGVFQFFEFFWSQDPWRTALTGHDSTPLAEAIRLAAAFHAASYPCMGRGSQRIRTLFPSVGLLLENARILFAPFLSQACVVNDFNERQNAKLKATVTRHGAKAMNFTVASNRCFCHNMNTMHCERGGVDSTSRAAKLAGKTAQMIQDMVAPSTRTGVGGSIAMEYHNMRMSVLTEMEKLAGDDAVRRIDLVAMEARIKEEWTSILGKPEEYEHWKHFFSKSASERLCRP